MTQLLYWAQSNQFFALIGLIVLLYITSAMCLFFLSKSKFFYIVLMPGIILHELSHLLACLITGAQVKSFKLFSVSGGYVIHGKPKLPIVGQLLISLFPLICAIAILYFLPIYLSSPEIGLKIFIYYLSASIILTMLPSKTDLINSFFSIALIVVIGSYLSIIGKLQIPELILKTLLVSLTIIFVILLYQLIMKFLWR